MTAPSSTSAMNLFPDLRFAYKIPTGRMSTGVPVLLVLALMFGVFAQDDKAVRFWGIPLTAHGATILFGSFCALFVLAAALMSWLLVRNAGRTRVLELTSDAAVVLKASLAQKMITVPYSTIRSVELAGFTPRYGPMIVIKSTLGRSHLMRAAFENEPQFTRFFAELKVRMTVARVAERHITPRPHPHAHPR
jgi:hypothetical protein